MSRLIIPSKVEKFCYTDTLTLFIFSQEAETHYRVGDRDHHSSKMCRSFFLTPCLVLLFALFNSGRREMFCITTEPKLVGFSPLNHINVDRLYASLHVTFSRTGCDDHMCKYRVCGAEPIQLPSDVHNITYYPNSQCDHRLFQEKGSLNDLKVVEWTVYSNKTVRITCVPVSDLLSKLLCGRHEVFEWNIMDNDAPLNKEEKLILLDRRLRDAMRMTLQLMLEDRQKRSGWYRQLRDAMRMILQLMHEMWKNIEDKQMWPGWHMQLREMWKRWLRPDRYRLTRYGRCT